MSAEGDDFVWQRRLEYKKKACKLRINSPDSNYVFAVIRDGIDILKTPQAADVFAPLGSWYILMIM